ncbi:MAG: hypothetical protein JSV91_11210 [Phycisphaerales bacterium]|nr:MAG: hypothetical protein JSV91_11210 [Phycisphaerales bacterium]
MSGLNSSLRSLRHAGGAVALAAVIVFTGSAAAQFGEAAGIAQSMQQEYFNRDITTVVRELELDQIQRLIVEALYEDYQTDFEAGLEQMKERFKSMRPKMVAGDEKRVMKMVFGPWEDWTVERKRLGEQFMENIKVILNQEQVELWPAFERSLFREKNILKGQFSGESIDLFNIVRDLHLGEPIETLIQPTMNDYDLALDAALRKREDVRRRSVQPMLRSLQESDAELSMQVIDEQIAARLEVRDVNDRYIEVIAAALPADLSEEFRQKALAQAYPRAYRPSPILRLFKAARELEDLSAAVVQEIEDLEQDFQREVAPLNDALKEAIRRHDPESFRWRAEVSAARMTGKSNPTKSKLERPDFNQRESLCRRFALLLRGLLTEEQYDSLPGSERWMRRLDPVQKERKTPESPRDAGTGTIPKPKDPRDPSRGRGDLGRGGGRGSTSM